MCVYVFVIHKIFIMCLFIIYHISCTMVQI